jgi:hypothetical protein
MRDLVPPEQGLTIALLQRVAVAAGPERLERFSHVLVQIRKDGSQCIAGVQFL